MPREQLISDFSRTNIPAFNEHVQQAFAFLETAYSFRLLESAVKDEGEWRDAQAMRVYLSDQLEVDIIWDLASVALDVRFVEVRDPATHRITPSISGINTSGERVIDLFTLAEALGHGDDPDFLLGDTWLFGGRIRTKRFKVLQRDLAGVISGLARTTERYGRDVLQGDFSVYPMVRRVEEEKRQAFYHGS